MIPAFRGWPSARRCWCGVPGTPGVGLRAFLWRDRTCADGPAQRRPRMAGGAGHARWQTWLRCRASAESLQGAFPTCPSFRFVPCAPAPCWWARVCSSSCAPGWPPGGEPCGATTSIRVELDAVHARRPGVCPGASGDCAGGQRWPVCGIEVHVGVEAALSRFHADAVGFHLFRRYQSGRYAAALPASVCAGCGFVRRCAVAAVAGLAGRWTLVARSPLEQYVTRAKQVKHINCCSGNKIWILGI